MAIDPANTNMVYCSLPIEGKYGRVYEIVKFALNEKGGIHAKEVVTENSQLNNIRPYMLPDSEHSPLRLTWMYGDYYDWIVSQIRPQGYSTELLCDFKGFSGKERKRVTASATGKVPAFNPAKSFVWGTDDYA